MSVTNIINERTETEDRLGSELTQNGNFSELGSDIIVNGDFATDSNWAKGAGWVIMNGYAESDGTNAPLDQVSVLTVGKTYKVVITVTNMTSSTLSVRLGTSSSDAVLSILENGTYTAYGVAGETTFRLRSQGFDGRIQNVSVKQVDPNDRWSLFNGATITNNKANIIGDGSAFGYIEQTNTFTIGKTYKITLDAVINSGGGLKVNYNLGFASNIGNITTSGSYTFTYTAVVTGSIIIGRKVGGAAYDSSVTNVSIVEVGADREAFSNETNQNGSSNIINTINERIETEDRLGSELVTNGGFESSASWTVSGTDSTHIATFSNGTLRYQSDTTSPQLIVAQASVLQTGRLYKITVNVTTLTSGYVKVDSLGGLNITPSEGTNIFYKTATGTTFNITRGTTNVDVTIDSISVKEVNVDREAFTNETDQNGVSVINNTVNERTEIEIGTGDEAFTNETDQNGTSTINNVVNERTIGLTFVETLLKAFRERVTYFENEECTKNDLNDLNNI